MHVVGVTTQQQVFVAAKDRKFRINEILVIEDPDLGYPKGEVVETYAYNRSIPMGFDKALVDEEVLEALKTIGYDIGADEVNLAKVRLFEEAVQPIRTGVRVREPAFSEVRDMLVKADPASGMVLGVIRSTEPLAATLEPELRDLFVLGEGGRVIPQNGVPFIFDIRAMQQYPHIGIFGGSGSGKSFGLRVMLEELMKLGVPTLVFDPHYEMDFSERDERVPDAPTYADKFVVVGIGRDVGIDFSTLTTREVENLLGAAGALTDAMANAVQTLHRRRDSVESFEARVSALAEALEEGRQGLEKRLKAEEDPLTRERLEDRLRLLAEYGSLPLASVRGILWRLWRLKQAGLFAHNIAPIERALTAGKLVVVQGPLWVLQVFASSVISTLYHRRRDWRDARLKQRQAPYFPPFVIVTDEAHNFAPKGAEKPAKPILTEIAQEGRKYGVFLILATQRPTLLDETITAQLNTKVVFRTVRGTDIATIREETDLTPEEAGRLPYLRSGDAFVSSAVFGRTLPVRIRLAHTKSPHTVNPFDELDEMRAREDEALVDLLLRHVPIYETALMDVLLDVNKTLGVSWDVARLKSELDRLAQAGKIRKLSTPFCAMYDRPKA